MRSCLILGSGRSGTSMVTGMLARSGYFLGGNLHAARAANPKGFFESVEVNTINEVLLRDQIEERPVLCDGQRWLGIPRAGATFDVEPAVEERITELLDDAPYCIKDPRFSFTLPAWRPFVGDAAFVCVFRHPALTVTSLIEEARSASYLQGVEFELEDAFKLWIATYRAILEEHSQQGDWLFLHYDQALEEKGCARLSNFLGAPVDADFADSHLRRLPPEIDVPLEALEVYAELCQRSGHDQVVAERTRPAITVVAQIEPGDEEHIADIVSDTRAQRGVEASLVLIDATGGEGLTCREAHVVPATSLSRGVNLREALSSVYTEYVAFHTPGCRSLPSRLARALDALEAEPSADIATCDLFLTDPEGQFIDRCSPGVMGEAPGSYWETGLVARRCAFEDLRTEVFFPFELDLYRRLREAGRALHLEEPGATVSVHEYAGRWDRTRQDAAFLVANSQVFEGERPALTVSLCTFNRRETLVDCLDSFCRQLLPRGTFEIVLTDDGSTDGTGEMLAGLEFAVPVTILHQPNGGLAAARNLGLAEARGELVLFVNDDTIAFPDLIENHLRSHRTATSPVSVLGTFEQPKAVLGNALMKHLESSTEVFGYADMTSGEIYDAFHFYTCNISVPLAKVREAGGFDTSFRHYGCEDTDLAFRLEALGLKVLYRATARAHHHHVLDFADLRKRARTVARAYVRFFRKHPHALERWSNEGLDRATCRDMIARCSGLRAIEEAAEELAQVDIGALHALKGDYSSVGSEVTERLGELVKELNGVWWQQGYLEGLIEHGLEGFGELLEAGAEPWPISTDQRRCLFAYPRWSDCASLDRLFERIAPIAGADFCALVLRFDPTVDGCRDTALTNLQTAFAARFGATVELDVVLEEAELTRAQLFRIARSVDAFLPLGGEPQPFLDAIGTERFESAEDVEAWTRRFHADSATNAESQHEASGAGSCVPELSVIVPTCNRPEHLGTLIACLKQQDLDFDRFEVILVDDGSRQPIPTDLGASLGIDLCVLRQENRGPAAARNLGLSRARGDLVLFLNDDAVPEPGVLSRHLEAHRWSSKPRAVLGRFSLLPARMVDSIAHHVETSTALFAQPQMKPGVFYRGLAFCTGNVSIPRWCLERVSGFDEDFPFPGGEDSEIGWRLERDLGVRVLYDPLIRCGHNHDLTVQQLVQRKRVIGWASYQIRAKHGAGTGMESRDWPQDDLAWEALRAEVNRAVTDCSGIERGVANLCMAEREAQSGPQALDQIRDSLERLEEIEVQRGMLMAHDGLRPDQVPGRPLLHAPARENPTAAAAL